MGALNNFTITSFEVYIEANNAWSHNLSIATEDAVTLETINISTFFLNTHSDTFNN